MRRFILLVLSAFICPVLWAVNGISLVQNTIGSGLESQSINVLTKDRQGRLWVGSDVGISLISNGIVTNIKDIVSEGGLVMLGNVNSIVCTESVLLACENRILHYDHRNGNARTLRYEDRILNTDYILLQESTAFFYDKDLCSLFSYDMESYECKKLSTFSGTEDYVFSKILCGSDSNVLYLADNKLGLFMFDLRNGSLRQVPGINYPIVSKATVIDNSNVIWISIPSKGMKGYYINGNYEEVGSYNTRNCDIVSDDITLITELPNGNLLTAHTDTFACIIERKRIENGRVAVSTIPDFKNVTSVLPNSQSQESLYGTKGSGIISLKWTFIGQIRHLIEHNEGIISYENYISAFEEPDGTVIFGTQDNGLCRIDPITQKKTVIKGTNQFTITSMCRFDDRHILMFDPVAGFVMFNSATNQMQPVPSDNPISGILMNTQNRNVQLISAQNGDIFIFNADSYHYVYRKAENSLTELFLKTDDGTPVTSIENPCISIYALYVTYRGTIIEINFNTLESLIVYRNQEKVIHNITSLAANTKGDLFFTEPEGLHRYDPRSNQDELLVETWGNGRFMNVTVDMRDRIWFTTTDEYLQLYDYDNKELLMYSNEDGVPASRFLNNFTFCTSSGILFFPNAGGMVTVNTNGSLMSDTPPVQVICISARAGKKNIAKSDLDRALTRPVRLPSKFTELSLEFSANAFNPTCPHLFFYNIYRNDMLIMTMSTTNTSINVPKLESGNYSVAIRQAYRKGLSDPVTVLRFKIPRPFLSTIPGVLLALLMLLVFGYTIARLSSSIEKNRMEKALAAQDIKNREDKIAFLSNIAHELRTPLSLIYNPVKDFLQEKSVDGIDYERMERIFNQVNKMTVMVNMILDSSRADVNKADILVEEVNLNEWLNFLLEDYRIDCYGKGFSLKFIMDNSIGTVLIDKRIIETGLSNMVNNAIKYSTSGTTITVSTTDLGDMIRVSVKDQGQGFSCDPEELFKRYYRENTDSSVPGYGLGLPYARLQLSLIGGNMSGINNEDGVGSTFFMDFPSAIGKDGRPVISRKKPQAEKENDVRTEEAMAQDFDTNDMTILFVNSDHDETAAFKEAFIDMFRDIYTAADCTEAKNLLKHTVINIIISDIDLPDMDGFELCRTIKGTLEISHIPVILLTSRSDKRNKNLGFKMGADAFLPKPFDTNQMYAIIRSQLGGRFEIKRQYNFRFFDKMSPDQTFSFTDEQFITSLNSLIDKNVSNPKLTDGMILQEMGISESVMHRKMNGLLATDLTVYLNRIRIGLVKDKLANTDHDLETIAAETGFTSAADMDKAFSRETGKSVFSARGE